MNIKLVQQLQQKAMPVHHSCRVLSVSRSGYYAAQRRAMRPPPICATTVRLKQAFLSSNRSYGSRRLQRALTAQGIRIGRYRVRRLMRAQQLTPIWKRRWVPTTDSRHHLPVFENLLNRQFNPAAANQAWVAAITYIRTRRGWVYLAAVLDLYSRKVVGWALAPSMPAELECAALRMAIGHRHPPPGLIMHSDRDSQ